MKSLKNIALSALLTIGAFGAVTFTACNKDDDSCPTGYEGSDCKTLSTAKFIGTWAVSETCSGTPSTPYQVTITSDPTDVTRVLVNNLGNYGCTVGGSITFNGTVNLTQITINDNKCSYQMNATGTYNTNGSLSINYTATYNPGAGIITDNCSATLVK